MHSRTCKALLAVGAAISCTSPPEDSRDTTNPRSETAAPVARSVDSPQAAREIYIDSVQVGDSLVVFGRARTFENTVQVHVRDARGAVLAQTFTTSVGEMGNHNPFVARLAIERDPGGKVTVEAFEYSANDGSVRSLTSRDVAFPWPPSRR